MLLNFSIENFLSFKNSVSLNMIAANPIKEHAEDNCIITNRYKILKSAVIYGANASGKSNLFLAMKFMSWFVRNSSKDTQIGENININSFKLSDSTENEPSHFEITILIDGIKYRYGFEANQKSIKSEWLFYAKKKQEKPLFMRYNDGIEVFDEFKEGIDLEPKTRSNALFLSVSAQFNGEISTKILNWFTKFRIISGLEDSHYESVTVSMLNNKAHKKQILEFLQKADMGIDDVSITELDVNFEDLIELLSDDVVEKLKTEFNGLKQHSIFFHHKKYHAANNDTSIASFDFKSEESEGTKKFFRIAGPIIDTLKEGSILVVDELDARLHPMLTQTIANLFNSKDSNCNNSQLIFATHDTNLLSSSIFRRDQIWFSEKDHQGATDLYSLAEYKLPKGSKVRKDASLEKDYIRGRYGAIPFIGDFSECFGDL